MAEADEAGSEVASGLVTYQHCLDRPFRDRADDVGSRE
jgi:hypothetical protein